MLQPAVTRFYNSDPDRIVVSPNVSQLQLQICNFNDS